METQEGQWVCVVDGSRLPEAQCPPDAKRYYMVDYVMYDSPEDYRQIQENARIQGEASKARYDAAPHTYPPCSADPPHGPETSCGYETCDLHNILWLEFDGCTHEQAIGLTAVYSFSESWGYGIVADTLGGMDEFNTLNENGPDVSGMVAWYNAHQPLIHYIMETRESEDLLPYWEQEKYQNSNVHVPKYVEWSMLVQLNENQQWVPYQLAGFPLIFMSDDDPDVSKVDPAYVGPEYWQSHHWARIRFDIGQP